MMEIEKNYYSKEIKMDSLTAIIQTNKHHFIRPKLVRGVYRFKSMIFIFVFEKYNRYRQISLQIFQNYL